jgi:hypothetical protein
VRRRATGGLDGPDALRVVTGIVTFFLLLNVFFGLGGRYDMTVAALGCGLPSVATPAATGLTGK